MAFARVWLVAGLVTLLAGFGFAGKRPAPAQLLPAVREDPLQRAITAKDFSVKAGAVDYTVKPVADYDIAGLVVSQHDSRTWWDTVHAESNDHLNVADLCLVWGANAADGAYEHMSFHNGQWTCYFSYGGGAPVEAAHVRAISNNHLLTENAQIARTIRSLRVGDQVRLRGQLASYSQKADPSYSRGTSTTREDTGNGACETVYVEQIDLLRRAPAWPRALRWIGALLLAVGLVLWYRAPFNTHSR